MTDIAGTTDDGWGVTDEYDIGSFYTRATDGRGHSDHTRVRIKPEVAGEIGALVSSGMIPDYSTSQDFVRDAIVHRLHWLAEHSDDPVLAAKLSETVRRTTIEETTSRYVRLIDSFEEFVGRTKEVVTRAISYGDHEGVVVFLSQVEEYATNSREPYRSQLMKIVDHYKEQVDWNSILQEPDTPLSGGIGPDNDNERD